MGNSANTDSSIRRQAYHQPLTLETHTQISFNSCVDSGGDFLHLSICFHVIIYVSKHIG